MTVVYEELGEAICWRRAVIDVNLFGYFLRAKHDVCNVVVFLASDQAGYMTGRAINVTGG